MAAYGSDNLLLSPVDVSKGSDLIKRVVDAVREKLERTCFGISRVEDYFTDYKENSIKGCVYVYKLSHDRDGKVGLDLGVVSVDVCQVGKNKEYKLKVYNFRPFNQDLREICDRLEGLVISAHETSLSEFIVN